MSTPTEQPTVLWEPTEELVERATITRFARWVAETRDVDVAGDYHKLWRWSVEDVEGFWGAIWEFFDVESESGYEQVLGSREMPGAEWFPGATVSYARHIFRGRARLARRREGRPRRRVHPEHPRGGVRAVRVRVDRRDLVVVLAGLRGP